MRGASILAHAGLLNGYRATTHQAYHLLGRYPGIEVCAAERVVSDRDRVTGGVAPRLWTCPSPSSPLRAGLEEFVVEATDPA